MLISIFNYKELYADVMLKKRNYKKSSIEVRLYG